MSSNLSDRRKALEDRFFQDQEAKKISRLREELTAKKNKEQLSAASGIEDDALLSTLVALDVGASDLTALAVIPLVRVAWADGTMKDAERQAVLEAARKQGVEVQSHSHKLLDAWLSNPPSSDLHTAWSEYVHALTSQMSDDQKTALKESVLGLAHDVASAAGGILGIGAISKSEQEVLTAIGDAFDQ